jgi:hypothetical protein
MMVMMRGRRLGLFSFFGERNHDYNKERAVYGLGPTAARNHTVGSLLHAKTLGDF